MNHKRHVEAFLKRQTDTRDYVLGAEFLTSEQPGSPTMGQAMSLRWSAARVGLSLGSTDQFAARQINAMFREKDAALAEWELYPRLGRPITQHTRIMSWLPVASRRDLDLFCRWNRRRTNHLQSALDRDSGDIDDDVMDKTHKLTEEGLFPASAPFYMEAALGRFGLQAMDTFYSGGKNANGLCLDDRVVITNLYQDKQTHENQSDEMRRTLFHEYLHAVGYDRGFFHGIKTQVPVMRLFEESFVEHATTVAYSDERVPHHVVEPSLHPRTDQVISTYRTERTLLSAIMNEQVIAPEELGEAFFTPMDNQRGAMLREDLERKIAKFFLSEQGLFDFNDDYEKSSDDKRQKLMKNVIKAARDRQAPTEPINGLLITA